MMASQCLQRHVVEYDIHAHNNSACLVVKRKQEMLKMNMESEHREITLCVVFVLQISKASIRLYYI